MHRFIEAKKQTKIYQHNFAPVQNSQDVFVSVQINYVLVQNTFKLLAKEVYTGSCNSMHRFKISRCILYRFNRIMYQYTLPREIILHGLLVFYQADSLNNNLSCKFFLQSAKRFMIIFFLRDFDIERVTFDSLIRELT
jgi:hypothetical protein